MTDTAAPAAPATGFATTLIHARYVLAANLVTAFAFALFALILLTALIGPYVVPYDPFASDTAVALKAPSEYQALPVRGHSSLPTRLPGWTHLVTAA